MSDSSIQRKLQSFENLISHIDELNRQLHAGVSSIDGQFNELRSSGKWVDSHAARFDAERLKNFRDRISSLISHLKHAQNFLYTKHETLKIHGQ